MNFQLLAFLVFSFLAVAYLANSQNASKLIYLDQGELSYLPLNGEPIARRKETYTDSIFDFTGRRVILLNFDGIKYQMISNDVTAEI